MERLLKELQGESCRMRSQWPMRGSSCGLLHQGPEASGTARPLLRRKCGIVATQPGGMETLNGGAGGCGSTKASKSLQRSCYAQGSCGYSGSLTLESGHPRFNPGLTPAWPWVEGCLYGKLSHAHSGIWWKLLLQWVEKLRQSHNNLKSWVNSKPKTAELCYRDHLLKLPSLIVIKPEGPFGLLRWKVQLYLFPNHLSVLWNIRQLPWREMVAAGTPSELL